MNDKIQSIIDSSKGTKGYYTILGKEAQERMTRNGWIIKHPQRLLKSPNDRYNSEEAEEEMIVRLFNAGYNQVKLYYVTTSIRGSYRMITMVRI